MEKLCSPSSLFHCWNCKGFTSFRIDHDSDFLNAWRRLNTKMSFFIAEPKELSDYVLWYTFCSIRKALWMEKGIQVLWWRAWEVNSTKLSIYQKGDEDGSPTRPYCFVCLFVCLIVLNLVKRKWPRLIIIINIINYDKKHESLSVDYSTGFQVNCRLLFI